MRSRLFWAFWSMVPVIALIWYCGPGQAVEARGVAAAHCDSAEQAAALEDWAKAAEEYGLAYENLPLSDVESRRVLSLRHARASFMSGKTWDGIADMEELLGEFNEVDPELAENCRYHLGTAQYFVAWKLRLEGAKAEIWKTEAEKARQHFRLLAESAQKTGSPRAEAFKKNVESVVWLQNLDLSELQALPLPGGC